MPSLYFTPSRGHFIIYKIYLPDGTKKRKTKYFKTKTLAQEALYDIQKIEESTRKRELTKDLLIYALNYRFINNNEYQAFISDLGTGGRELKEYTKDYEIYSETNCSPYTHDCNLYKMNIVLSYFGATDVADITETQIERYKSYRLGQGRAASTVNHELNVLRKMLDFALTGGMIKINPARRIPTVPDKQVRYPRALQKKERKVFLKAIKNNKHLCHGQLYNIVVTLLLTGMRRSELLSLTWNDVDLKRKLIYIKGKPSATIGKMRTIEIHKKLYPILMKMSPKEGYIFKADKDVITKSVRKCVREADLPPEITLHSLRHSFISYLIESRKASIKEVQELAGHSKISTTQRYMHIVEAKKGLIDMIDF